ncbi:MAG: DnaJ domain-containing protein [Magnetococcales bacterium]|nr:DnaJ domain-containing protein [Magnetococcales bacterium]
MEEIRALFFCLLLMKPPTGDHRDKLLDQLHAILCEFPAGIKEYALYDRLRKDKIRPFFGINLGDELQLYRIHFLLFHLLYLLQDRLRRTGDQTVEIHCLNICIKPWHPPSDTDVPELSDPLRGYYKEVARLETVQRQEVSQMISDFWLQFERQDQRSQALAQLGLNDPVENDEIKSQYRKQAKMHHPDRGGDPEQFRIITAAVDVLLNEPNSR